jgi:hypothetical protein
MLGGFSCPRRGLDACGPRGRLGAWRPSEPARRLPTSPGWRAPAESWDSSCPHEPYHCLWLKDSGSPRLSLHEHFLRFVDFSRWALRVLTIDCESAGQQNRTTPPAGGLSQPIAESSARGSTRPRRWEGWAHGAHPEPATVGQVRRAGVHRWKAGAHRPHADLATVLGCRARPYNILCTDIFHAICVFHDLSSVFRARIS